MYQNMWVCHDFSNSLIFPANQVQPDRNTPDSQFYINISSPGGESYEQV